MSDDSGGDSGGGGDGIVGHLGAPGRNSDNANHNFHHHQENGYVRTAHLVKIVKVYGGGVGPSPTVDVTPLVNQTDGAGNQMPHGTIYGLQAPRHQAGANTIIADPVVGDVGYIMTCDRDHSGVLANLDAANPGSNRRHDFADSYYVGHPVKKDAPTNYVNLNDGNIVLNSPGTVTVVAPNIKINGNVDINS